MTSFENIKITHITTVIGRRKTPSREPQSLHHLGDTIDEALEAAPERPTQPIIRQ